MKTKLIILRTLILLILFNINIGYIECVNSDSSNISFSTLSEIQWDDPAYIQGDVYTVNIYSDGILHYSAITYTHTAIVSLPLSDNIKIELIKHKPGDYTSFKVLSIVTLEEDSHRHKILL